MFIRYKHVRARERPYDSDSDYHRPLTRRNSSKHHRVVVEPSPYPSDRSSSPSASSTPSSSSTDSDWYYKKYHRHVRHASPAPAPRPLKSALKKTSRAGSRTRWLEEYNVFNDGGCGRDTKSYDRGYDDDHGYRHRRGKRDSGVVDDDWDRIEEWDKEWKYTSKSTTTRTRTPSPAYSHPRAPRSPRLRTSSFSYEHSRVRSVSPSPVRTPTRSWSWGRSGRGREYVPDREPKVWPRDAFRPREAVNWDSRREGWDGERRNVTVVPKRERESEVRYRTVRTGEWKPLRGWRRW